MNSNLCKLRNTLLFGRERHPWDHHYQVRRCDVKPGLKINAWLSVWQASGVPVITRDSEMKDALAHPEKYSWIARGSVRIGTLERIPLTFTSDPYLKEGHWFANAVDTRSGEEQPYSLFSLGIVPDYVFNPVRFEYDPAGWNPNCKSSFD